MDDFSASGTLTSATNYADYRLRANRIMDRIQKDLAFQDKIKADYQVTRYPFKNQMGVDHGYDLIQHFNEDIDKVSAVGSRAYYFEVDGPCSALVQEETSTDVWNTLSTVAGTSALTEFTPFKGKITAASTANNIRVLFTGDYPYRIRNTALWNYLWASGSDIPDYRKYVKYTMPTKFMGLDKIIIEDGEVYAQQKQWYWEDPRTLMLDYNYQGSFTVFYYKTPDDIESDDTTPTTYDAVELELTEVGQDVMAYGVASELLMAEGNYISLAVQLQNMYLVKKEELAKKIYVPTQEAMTDVKGW